MKKILIMGAKGFIGSAFKKHLAKDSLYELICVDIEDCQLEEVEPTKELIKTTQPDYIVHLAGGRMSEPELLERSNIQTTQNLFQAIIDIENYAPRVLLPGSAAEYGKISEGAFKAEETSVCEPTSTYGRVKHSQVQLALEYASKGMSVCVARIFNIIGTNTPEALVAGRFARQIIDIEQGAESVIQTWNLNGRRDFVDIHDVVRALTDILTKGLSGEIYNVCSGAPVEIRDLLKQMIQASKAEEIQIQEDASKGQDSYDCVGSYQKLYELSGWEPEFSLKQSINQLLESYRR